jgi:hypothetical protein
VTAGERDRRGAEPRGHGHGGTAGQHGKRPRQRRDVPGLPDGAALCQEVVVSPLSESAAEVPGCLLTFQVDRHVVPFQCSCQLVEYPLVQGLVRPEIRR